MSECCLQTFKRDLQLILAYETNSLNSTGDFII